MLLPKKVISLKLPPFYRIILRLGMVVLVVAATLLWAVHNPRQIGQLRGMLALSFTSQPAERIMEIDTRYAACGHSNRARTTFPSEAALQSAVEQHAEYRFQKQTGNLYRYAATDDGLCPSCKQNQFLGLDNQQVVVYHGTPSQPGPVAERLSLPIQGLPQSELDDLKKGIPFKDSREKLQLIEGLNGINE